MKTLLYSTLVLFFCGIYSSLSFAMNASPTLGDTMEITAAQPSETEPDSGMETDATPTTPLHDVLILAKLVEIGTVFSPSDLLLVATSIGIAAYADFNEKAQMASVFASVDTIKRLAEVSYASEDHLPTVEELKAQVDNPLIKEIRMLEGKNGYVFSIQDNTLQGQIQLKYDKETRVWTCKADGFDKKYLLSHCQ